MTKDNQNTCTLVLGMCVRMLMNIVFVFLLMQGFTYSYRFSYNLFADLPAVAASSDKKNITINDGNTVKDIALLLETNGIVEDKYIFLARAYIGKYHSKMRAGTYTLGPGMTPDEICKMICGIQSEETS